MTAAPTATSTVSTRFRVGDARVDVSANEVVVAGQTHRIEGRTMAVLAYLAGCAGDVARREALMAEVWRGRIVTDDSLTRAIAQLRQVLGDAAAIETIPKVGYRLKWSVSPWPETDALDAAALPDGHAAHGPQVASGSSMPNRSRWIAGSLSLLAVAMLIAVFARNRDDELPAIRVQSVTPVSAIPGIKRMPRFSRDGQQLAFDLQQDGGGGRDVWVTDLTTRTSRQITRDAADEQTPDWLPDGNALVFVRTDRDRCALVRKNLASGVETIVRPCQFAAFLRPRVSPDGRRVVYTDLVANATQAVVYEADLRTGEQVQLTRPEPGLFDLYPEYTADGRQILFGRAPLSTVRNLYLLDRQSGAIRLLHREPAIIADATMERDDIYMFATTRSGQMQLIRRDFAGHEQALPLGADVIRGATLSPDRQRLVYEGWTLRGRIVESTVGGGAPRDVVVSSRVDRNPKLSPDGRRLAFVSLRDGYANLWISENGEERPLTHFRSEDPDNMAWHPTEPLLAFSMTRTEGSFVCVIDVRDPKAVPHCPERPGSSAPYWSADGQHFGFAAPDGAGYAVFELDRYDADGTPQRVIADAFAVQPLASGGKCFMRAGRDGIWCDTGVGATLVLPQHPWPFGKNWTVAGDRVLALQPDGQLLSVPVTGGAAVADGVLPGRIHWSSGLNRRADGTFVYGIYTTYDAELLLAEMASH